MKILLFINTLYITLVFLLVLILLSIGYWISLRRNKSIYKKKAINILKRENLYRTLFDNTGTCTLLIDKDLIILLSNSEFKKLAGYSRSETDGILNLKELVHISDSKKFYDYANHVFSDGKNTEKQTELRITNKFGEEKHCICKLTPIKGFNQCIVSLADITINKSNEQMLIESREQYKAFLNAIPNLIFNIDEKGRIIDSQDFGNRTFHFFETHPSKAVFIHELFRAEVATDITFYKDIAINSNKTTQLDFCLSDNNKLLFFEAQFVPIGAKQLLFIVHDITERIEKDKTIKILGHAVKEVSECVNITDENNIIQYVNKAFLKTYGYTESEVIGKNVNIIVSKNNSDKLLDEIKEARLKGFWQGELLNIRKNKKEFPVYLSTSLIKDDELKTIAIFAVSIDITERIKQTNDIQRLNNELLEKNKELEQIVYIASHDLRSPLINIEGFSYELSKLSKGISESMSSNQKEKLKEFSDIYSFIFEEIPGCLEYIQASTKKMDALIAGLLKISRLGRESLKIKTINMNEFVADVLQNFSFQINQKKAEIIMKKLPPCNADVLMLNMVFSNLLANALKYTHPNLPPIIEIGGSKEDGMITYYIKDNGIGVPENKLEEIFKIFYRLSNDNTGEGLGLSIVKKIVEKHNGNIYAANNDSQGSCFFIELPAN